MGLAGHLRTNDIYQSQHNVIAFNYMSCPYTFYKENGPWVLFQM